MAAALVAAGLVPALPTHAAKKVPGIDVSQWQDNVDWPTVAGVGTGFVIIRATKGDDYRDPMYTTHLAGALANQIVPGAYHRATPSLARGDALAEANFFLKEARNEAGDVLPVLDIEETGGLNVVQLQDWVRTWVVRVRSRLGVRPMIYASPYFWETNMGDTTWFADRGYPLWVAHWDAPSPRVPAGDWGGHGWTYWQWTVGTLDGVEGPVDRDRFMTSDLTDGTIASLRVRPASGGTITGPRISCGGDATRCRRLANPSMVITLTAAPNEAQAFHGWTGACAPAGTTPTCDVTLRGAMRVSAVFQPVVVLPEDGEGSSFGWGTRSAPTALGGSFRFERREGASLSFEVTGGRVTVHAVRGPAMGKVRIEVDGARVSVIDGWARETGIERHVFEGLGSGAHTLNIVVLGTARPRSSGTGVGVDALRWGGEVRDDPDPAAATWGRLAATAASDGIAVISDVRGARASLAFAGVGVTWITSTGPGMGRAEVWIDGRLTRVVGLYDATRSFGVRETFRGLSDANHRIRIVVQGRKNPASAGSAVVVDGWIVR